MIKPKVLVLTGYGINCDEETARDNHYNISPPSMGGDEPRSGARGGWSNDG